MKKDSVIQFIKFGLVGVSNTMVSWAVYMTSVRLGAPYIIANILAFVISVFSAFLLQNRFVFKEDENLQKRVWWQVLIKTYTAYAFTGLFLSSLLLTFWIDIVKVERFAGPVTALVNRMGIDIDDHGLVVYAAPLLNVCVNVPINYIANKFWAYRQKKKSEKNL